MIETYDKKIIRLPPPKSADLFCIGENLPAESVQICLRNVKQKRISVVVYGRIVIEAIGYLQS